MSSGPPLRRAWEPSFAARAPMSLKDHREGRFRKSADTEVVLFTPGHDQGDVVVLVAGAEPMDLFLNGIH